MNNPSYPKHYMERFKTIAALKPPDPIQVFARVLTMFILLMMALLTFTPWVQTAPGKGTMTALYPEDRLQTINVLTNGRIKHWYVREGSRVVAGDPIVEILDNDPLFIDRLTAERDAKQRKLNAVRIARETAKYDYDRKKSLYEKGLVSRKEFEEAKISYNTHLSKEAEVVTELQRTNTKLSRQHTQLVRAPKDGIIVNIGAGDIATFVKEGTPIATFVPDHVARAVELFVNGNDVPLIHPGREVRMQFEGWPVIQFSGWPEMAIGTFPGIVTNIDPSISPNGMFRIMVTEDPKHPWPDNTFLRFGAKVRGWVLLNTVSLGYELWRQLNNFPPEYGKLLNSMRGVPGLGTKLPATGDIQNNEAHKVSEDDEDSSKK